jgi:eukaryotic-like serine/threonine-protein kinase
VPSLAGTKLDKYDMLEEVGHGGMAVVYRGHDTVLEREVAVKVLHAHLSDRAESRLRLQREALAVAKLRHENILEIFDYSGTDADESYLVTEFIHGPTLREWIDEHLDPRPAVAAMIIHRLCLALVHAHKSGIVHRDIKPENVMIRLEDGCIKLMDFGIAQILDNQKLTLTGQLIGSPAYMAPELINGRPLDARTDLFSLGIMLYQLATGALPFSGRNPHEVLNRIADGEYAAPSTICPLVDRELEAIIAKALASNPDDRFQSVETLAAELCSYLEEMGLEPSPQELCAYFRNPADYALELDERVSVALMEQAGRAAADGSSGRAIRLLGRVLEIDPEHKAARAMLARLRTRERRMRQGLVAGGLVAVAGLVAAGVMLLPPGDGPAERGSKEAHDAHAMVSRTNTPEENPTGPGPDAMPVAAADDDDDGSDETSGGPAESLGTQTGGPTESASVRPIRPKINKEAHRAAVPEPIACQIQLEGIPKGLRKDVTVRVGRQDYPGGDRVSVELIGDKAELLASHERWEGRRTLIAPDCRVGIVPVRLDPKPATVKFVGNENITVQCLAGCPPRLREALYFDAFAKVEIPLDGLDHNIRVVFKRAGFESREQSFRIHPGRNEISIDLDPR